VLTCMALGGDSELAFQLSSLVELPHNASLIVDDIEDNSTLRRGEVAMHLLFGQDVAINSANFAYFSPSVLLQNLSIDPLVKLQLYDLWLLGLRRVHLGQGLDIAWHSSKTVPSVADYKIMCQLKTGAMAAMAVGLGAALSDASLVMQKELADLWLSVGLAFQIMDDVGNLRQTIVGKAAGDDIQEGKKSLPVVLFCQKHPEKQLELLDLMQVAKTQEVAIGQVIELLQASDSVETAEQQARQLLHETQARMEQLLAPSWAREQLFLLMKRFMLQSVG
jgi:geranylgeranyl pyrophosphate synthase